jgi:hypothetical protein
MFLLSIIVAIAVGLFGADLLLTTNDRACGRTARRPWLKG